MKDFIAAFMISLVLCYFFLFFGGGLVFGNIWALLVLVALFIAILTTIFIHQETKNEELEARIKALEHKSESQK